MTRFNEHRGAGVVASDVDGTELFVHVSETRDSGGCRGREHGQHVESALRQGPCGPRAAEIGPL